MEQDDKQVYFITDRIDHDPLIYKSTKIAVIKTVCQLDQWLAQKQFAGLDIEANGNRIYVTDLLLLTIGDKDTQFVVDCTSGLLPEVRAVVNKHSDHIMFFGHNIKYDFNHLYVKQIYIERIYDTMTAEQRIGLGRTDWFYDLEEVAQRRINVLLEKSNIGASFLSMTLASKFQIWQIIYASKDVRYLIDIARAQRGILRSFGQYDWFLEVENQLTTTLGEMELEGIKNYGDKWTIILDKKGKQLKEQQIKLDVELGRLYSKSKPDLVMNDLFGSPLLLQNAGKKRINYNSSEQIVAMVKNVDGKAPIFKEKGQPPKESAREAAIQQYLIDNPNTEIKPFLKEYLTFKEYKTFLANYGTKFLVSEYKKQNETRIGFLNPVTQLVHTIFKQCSTDTGRLASGDTDWGYWQSHNMVREKEVRECFGLTEAEIAYGYYLTTCDLSGAEATIMAAFADEQEMYKLAILDDDVHSPIATECWRAVYQYRVKLGRSLEVKDSTNKVYTLTEDFLITKSQNKGLRQDFKNFTFGAIYGMKDNKGAQTLNVPKDEAQIMINTIKRKFPKIFKMVEDAEQCAFADGFVILNCISNNRRWFTEVLSIHKQLDIADRNKRYHQTRQEISFKEMMEVSGAARNVRIQGTQSDMLKHAMVRIRNKMKDLTRQGFSIGQQAIEQSLNVSEMKLRFYDEYNKRPFGRQKLSVHDELVVKHKSKEFGNDVAEIMTTTANEYLAPYSSNVRMKADFHTLTHWTK